MNKVAKKKTVAKVKGKPKKKRASKYEEKVTLAPLTFDEAMTLAVKTKIK